MSKYSKVSIVIATLNSDKILEKVLQAIKKQKYPKDKIEILIIDGGSNDRTLLIAKKFKCRILRNSKVDQVYAKHMGYLKARGRYLMFLDSDEVLLNSYCIRRKVEAMVQDGRVKAVISSGYVKPKSYPEINSYLSELGDPFTFFMYRDSKDPRFFIKNLISKYKVVQKEHGRVIFDFSESPNPPFIELTSMGVLLDLKYIKSNFSEVLTSAFAHTHLFYLLNSKKNLFSVTVSDPVAHYSVSTLNGYLKKIRSRIKSNIYGTSMGNAGFSGRERYYSRWYGIKKFLFVFYCLSIILPLIDSIYLILTRKSLIYLCHYFLCFYTLGLIIYYYILKLLRVKIKLYGYGT